MANDCVNCGRFFYLKASPKAGELIVVSQGDRGDAGTSGRPGAVGPVGPMGSKVRGYIKMHFMRVNNLKIMPPHLWIL